MTNPVATMDEMVAAVKAYASANYERRGWDYVVETMDDANIADFIGKARTVAGAILKVGNVVLLWHSVREDVRGA